MWWALELELGFQFYRQMTKAPDDRYERVRWIKMCHRLGEFQSIEIIERQVNNLSKAKWTFG